MPIIKVNISNLSDELGKIKKLHAISNTTFRTYNIIYPTNGKGKTQGELISVDKKYKDLNNNIDNLINSVDTFFSCAKDGIVDADEYTKKIMKNLG